MIGNPGDAILACLAARDLSTRWPRGRVAQAVHRGNNRALTADYPPSDLSRLLTAVDAARFVKGIRSFSSSSGTPPPKL